MRVADLRVLANRASDRGSRGPHSEKLPDNYASITLRDLGALVARVEQLDLDLQQARETLNFEEERSEKLYRELVEAKEMAKAKELEAESWKRRMGDLPPGANVNLFTFDSHKKQEEEIVRLQKGLNQMRTEAAARAQANRGLKKELCAVRSESASRAATLNREIAKLRDENAGLRNELDGWSTPLEEDDVDEVHETTLALDAAADAVCGPRARDYGDPSEQFEKLAGIWTAYLGLAEEDAIDARDVCLMMIHMKTMRDSNRRVQDNLVDIAGYAQLASWIGDPREEAE